MAAIEKVTVDKSYFDALLRRADFHTSAQILGRADPASVTISRVEYDSLLRTSREFELLKTSLYQGGLTPETLALLIAGATVPEQQQRPVDSWADDYDDQPMPYCQPKPFVSGPSKSNGMSWRSNSNTDDGNTELDTTARGRAGETLRTLYFCNLSPKTSYKDLASVIKGGKVLSITIRSERSATVTFLDAAADYLTWSKRNDVYLHARRVEVRWAERQSNLNGHIANKITNGATRNILIRNAVDKGLTEQRIRDDMEHIHGLVIIEVTYQSGNAYVSTNSVHNALFARTCMMSRSDYRGCKIEFYPDECDVALPARAKPTPTAASEPTKRHMAPNNRFDMLNMSSNGSSGSDEENRDPLAELEGDSDDEVDSVHIVPRAGVRLDFLDSESTA